MPETAADVATRPTPLRRRKPPWGALLLAALLLVVGYRFLAVLPLLSPFLGGAAVVTAWQANRRGTAGLAGAIGALAVGLGLLLSVGSILVLLYVGLALVAV